MAELACFPPAVVAMAKQKAAELEEFQEEPSGEEGPEAKKRRSDKRVNAHTKTRSFWHVELNIQNKNINATISEFTELQFI